MGVNIFCYSCWTVSYFHHFLKIVLDCLVKEINLMNYLRGKKTWFAKKLLCTTSDWRSFTPFRLLLLWYLWEKGLCFLIKYYHLRFNINTRYQTFLSKTCWYFLNSSLYRLCRIRNLVQYTANVHHAQLFLGTKIYSPY